jgi:hypothetical protein
MTLAAVDTKSPVTIENLTIGYDGTPTGGGVTIESPSGTTIFEQKIATADPKHFGFSGSGLNGAAGEALIVTLAAAGAVTGRVSAVQRTT